MAQTVVEETALNAVQEYAEKQAEHQALAGRLRELDDANLVRILTADEAIEASMIERRPAGLALAGMLPLTDEELNT